MTTKHLFPTLLSAILFLIATSASFANPTYLDKTRSIANVFEVGLPSWGGAVKYLNTPGPPNLDWYYNLNNQKWGWDFSEWTTQTYNPNPPYPAPSGMQWAIDGTDYGTTTVTNLVYDRYIAYVPAGTPPPPDGDAAWIFTYQSSTTETVTIRETTYWTLVPVPAPSALILVSSGLVSLVGCVRKRLFGKV